jgi:hypothetical protein
MSDHNAELVPIDWEKLAIRRAMRRRWLIPEPPWLPPPELVALRAPRRDDD